MADPKTRFETNDALTRKKWAKELFRVLLPSVEFNDLIGKDSTSVVQKKMDLAKGEGDEMTFGIRLPLTGEGIVGDDTLEGNEEKLRFRNFKATIEELNHAVDTGGKMEEQRVPYNLIEEGKNGLQDWWGEKLTAYMFAVMCGDTTFKIAGKTFANAPEDPSADKFFRVNDKATEALLTSEDILDLRFLDRMKQRAEMPQGANNYKVRPITIKGKKYYRVILHTYVFDQLRENMNKGQWGDLLREAGKLGVENVEFVYNGMMVSKSEHIRKCPTNDSAYRNILLGAQAAVMGWGGAGDSKSTVMSFVPYTRDAKRYVMIRGGGILGIRKVRFDSVDFGIITGSSYATQIS